MFYSSTTKKKRRKMRFVLAAALLALLPFASAFHPLATSPNDASRSLSRRSFVPSPLSVSRAEVSDSVHVSEQKEPWWKNYELAHADVAQQTRSDFPILSRTVGDDNKQLVYLDSAATSQKPRQVLDCLQEYYQEYNSNVHRGAHLLSRDATAAYETARDSIASFIGAENRNEIVFTSGATEAINLVANSYGRSTLRKGDEIVLTEMEHHSNLVPWQMVAQATGATIKYVKIDSASGGLDLEHFSSLLNENTKIVGFQHVSNVMGCINPVEDIVKLVRESARNAKIVLDACQSVPHQTVNVKKLGVDFVAASGHKMCAPTGIGFLWAPEGLLNSMPPFLGGGEMIDQVTLEGSTYAPAPARFEAGTPAIAQAIGMGAAVKYLQNIGMDRIEAYEHELADYLYRRLSDIDGVVVLGPPAGTPRAALCAFVCDNVHPSDLSTFLDIEGVAIRAGHHCCQPLHQALGYSHSARASLYFYNTKEDVDIFIQHLQHTMEFFRSVGGGEHDGGDDDFVPFI